MTTRRVKFNKGVIDPEKATDVVANAATEMGWYNPAKLFSGWHPFLPRLELSLDDGKCTGVEINYGLEYLRPIRNSVISNFKKYINVEYRTLLSLK